MYRATQDFDAYVKREGSHATRPKKVGHNDDMHNERTRDGLDYKLAAIKEAQNIINNIESAIILKKIEYQELSQQLVELKEKLAVTLPIDEYHKLKSYRGQIVKKCEKARNELSELTKEKKKFNHGKYSGEWQVIFTQLASNILPPDIFRDLAIAAKEIHDQQKRPQEASHETR